MVGNGGNTGVTVWQRGVAGCEMIEDLVYGRGRADGKCGARTG